MAKLDIEVEEPDVDEEDAGGEPRGGVSALREVSISKRPRRRDVRGAPPSRGPKEAALGGQEGMTFLEEPRRK